VAGQIEMRGRWSGSCGFVETIPFRMGETRSGRCEAVMGQAFPCNSAVILSELDTLLGLHAGLVRVLDLSHLRHEIRDIHE
jgi:hypothetical protein